MNRFLRRTAALCAAALLFAASACKSTEPADAPTKAAPQLVSASELAERLHLERRALDDSGKIVLFAPADGGEIALFPETTVVSVSGTQFTASSPIELRGGEAWLTKDDASAVEALWSGAAAATTWIPPVVAPLDLPPPKTGPHVAPALGPHLPYGDQATASEIRAWTVPLRMAWRYIVIHHSATSSGNAAKFDVEHKQRGWEGLGYDFVIDNGSGGPDGAVEVGFRWREQKVGAHAGPGSPRNKDGIGICLVGDFTKTRPTPAQMRSLSRLCNFLSSLCGIPRENYLLHGDVRQTTCPGPLFPRDFISPSRRVAATSPSEDDVAFK